MTPLIAMVMILIGGMLGGLVAWRASVRRSALAPSGETIRRSAGNALFLLEEFVNPRVEHVVTARQDRVEDDEDSDGGDRNALAERLRTELRASLAHPEIDPDEIRRHLALAVRSGLDWRSLYGEAVRDEIAARPFRAPSLPPSWRVAPRVVDDLAVGERPALP